MWSPRTRLAKNQSVWDEGQQWNDHSPTHLIRQFGFEVILNLCEHLLLPFGSTSGLLNPC